MDKRVKRTKALIKNAFLDLLQNNNITNLSVTELAKHAEIDRRTFYLHYSCIDDILLDIEKKTVNDMQELLMSMESFNLNIFFSGLTKIMTDYMEFWKLIVTNDRFHRFLIRSKDNLKLAFHNEFFEKSGLSEKDFEIYSEYVASGITSIYYSWIFDSTPIPLEELTQKAEKAVEGSWSLITGC